MVRYSVVAASIVLLKTKRERIELHCDNEIV